MTGTAGNLAERVNYEPFGDSNGSALTRYDYTGRERDSATGLLYYRARWTDPKQGRFISEDPIGFRGGLNLYAYVGNNPINHSDPRGLIAPLVFVGGVFAMGGAVVGVASVALTGGGSTSDYVAAGLGGAAAGIALLTDSPVLSGAVGGAVTNGTKQLLDNLTGEQCGFDSNSFLTDTAIGAALGKVPFHEFAPKIPVLNRGTNSFNSVYKSTSKKLKNGSINKVSGKTFVKSVVGTIADGNALPAGVAGEIISHEVNR
jgi:RHS repeat-associated protein